MKNSGVERIITDFYATIMRYTAVSITPNFKVLPLLWLGIGVYNNLINDDDNGGSGMIVGFLFCGGVVVWDKVNLVLNCT